jgi:phage-related protein
VAEILLGIIAAASKLVAMIKLIPAPILTAFVAIHSAALWGGLAITNIRNMALKLAGALGNINGFNGPMAAFSKAIGATHDQLAALGEAAPGVDKIADDIAAGAPGAYKLADALELSNKSIINVVSKTDAVESAAKAVGASANDVATFAVAMNKTGVSVEDMAAKAAGGTDKLAELTDGMSKGASDAANLAMAFTMTGKGEASAAEAAEKVASGAGEAAASTGMFSGALSGLADALPGGPIAWIIALAAAIAGVGVYLGMQPDTTQRWINALNQSVQSASDINMLGTTVSALAADTSQLANAQKTATGNTTELQGAQAGLSGDLQRELTHVGALQKAYGVSMPQALALLQTAGVKSTDLFQAQGQAWQVDLEMVHGLTQGYAAMGQQMGSVGSDMNALAVSQSAQLSSMQNLNSAYDTFTSDVAAPYSDMMTLAQGMQTFATDAGSAGSSMTGLGANALTLQQQFQTVYGNVEQAFDSFRSSQALSGGGGDFTQYVKDAVAALLPLTGGSAAARAEVSALAQEAGGPATTSMSTLTKWVGNIKNPLTDMYKASQNAAIGASNLNQDAEALSNSLQSALNPALTQATMTALGGQQALSTFADDLLKFGPNSAQTIAAGKKVAEMFLSIDGNSKSAEPQFIGWAESMGLTAKQATQLWDKVSKGEKPMASVRKALASTSEAVKDLGKPGMWGQVEHAFESFFDKIGGLWGVLPMLVLGGLAPVFGMFHKQIADFIRSATSLIASSVAKMWDPMVAAAVAAFNKIKKEITTGFDAWWKQHGEEVKEVAHAAWVAVSAIITFSWKVVENVLHTGLAWIRVFWPGTWDIIKAVFTTVWNAIKIITVTTWDVIATVISTGVKMIADIIGIILDVITGHWGQAWSDMKSLTKTGIDGVVKVLKEVTSGFITLLYTAGVDLIEGLIKGIGSMASHAGDAILNVGKGMWDDVTSFFDSHSPSMKFAYLGEMIVVGLSLGITTNAQKAIDESRRLAQAVTQAAMSGQITAAEKKALSAQLAAALHDAISKGMQTGLTGSVAQIGGAMTKIFAMLGTAVSSGQVTKTQSSGVVAWLDTDTAKLQNLARQRAKIGQQIATADAYMASTSQAAESNASLGAIISSSSGSATPTIKSIISTLGKDLSQIRAFKSNILKLQKMGLNKQYISQLIAAGPSAAGAIAAELAAGTWAQIHEINTEKSAILTASNQLGVQAADTMYDSGKQAGEGFLSGLKAQQASITQMMKKIADAVIKELKKDLGIASPSRVMMAHGQMVSEGFARGIEAGVGRVKQAARSMSIAASMSGMHSSVITGGSNGAIIINLRNDITGRVDKQVLWTAMQQETLKYNIRNTGVVTGNVAPGRL